MNTPVIEVAVDGKVQTFLLYKDSPIIMQPEDKKRVKSIKIGLVHA